MHPPSDLAWAVEKALHAVASAVEPAPGSGWRATLSDGLVIRARLEGDDWLDISSLDGSPAPAAAKDVWTLLGLNAGLRGGVRAALTACGATRFRADLFVGAEGDEAQGHAAALEARVDGLCRDLMAARRALAGSPSAAPAGEAPAPVMGDEDSEYLARLCVEAGWGEARNGSGVRRVALDARGEPLQALMTLAPASFLRVVVPLTAAPLTSCASREAVGRLLLRASSAARAVKGVVLHGEGMERPALAAACDEPVESPAALDRALSALAVACDRVAREARALEDESVARAYLAVMAPGARDVELAAPRT